MRVCLIIDDYLPLSIKAGSKMMHELGVEFIRQGHDVTVITPVADLDAHQETLVIDHVNVHRFRSGKIKNVNKIVRAINETMLSTRAWLAYREFFKSNPHDLIIYYSPTIFWGGLVQKLKNLWGAPSYLILRDFFPQWVIDNGLLPADSLITKYFRYFEKANYKSADIIALQSPKNLSWFSKQVDRDDNLEVLFNWADTEVSTTNSNTYRKVLGLKGKIVFFYGGNIGHAQDMMNIVRLANNLKTNENAHFVLVGNGDEVGLVQEQSEKLGLENLTLLPAVNQSEYEKLLSEFDIGLFSLNRGHSTQNFPGKLLGYMRHSKPILGSINPGNDLKEVIDEANAGLISINGDDETFFENALRLSTDETLRRDMSNNSKRLLESTFSVENAAHSILDSFNRLNCS